MIENLFIFSGLVLLSGAAYRDNKLIKISKYQIQSNKVPKEFNKFKIIQLSDFHNYIFNKNNSRLVKKILKENPDIIVMTGDMVNKYDKDFNVFLNLAETLSKKYKIYYIIGNHEKRLKKEHLNLLIKKLTNLNINVVNDKNVTIIRNNERIHIYGFDIPLSFYKTKNKPKNIEEVIYKALNKCEEKNYNILLAHNPLFFDIYAKYNVDLTLSGHVHGGMIRLPFIGGLLSPERKFFPKYSEGVYEINNKKLIVSRGLGYSKPGFRVNNMPEIVSITLLNL
ncbi:MULTISPECIES: metallophosphoesterase [unclassified Clostridium]|uniref:metallophosphoesterase n=1 Tax=unclassified Clostridium TaxID=2614128 RepID=UPI0002977D03|nr:MULTISPECIES: metallophosphoesterase [unclassified Clostridium]EKQ56692.1 MAG: putative phosphohydrolase [Clostridium sp. Maddingley MBC34-26]